MRSRIRVLLLTALVALPCLQLSAQTRQASMRAASRTPLIARTSMTSGHYIDGHEGCGCDGGMHGGWEVADAGCGVHECAPCCPCLLRRLAAGIGRTLDCIFTCRACSLPCGNACVSGPIGCGSCGIASGRFHGGCASCGSDGMPMEAESWEPGMADPFQDDMEVPSRQLSPPVPPTESRQVRSSSHKYASRSGKSKKAVEMKATRGAPRQIAAHREMVAKPLSSGKARVVKQHGSGRVVTVMRTSGEAADRYSSSDNPLR